jgi:hypothetical protein
MLRKISLNYDKFLGIFAQFFYSQVEGPSYKDGRILNGPSKREPHGHPRVLEAHPLTDGDKNHQIHLAMFGQV